MSNTLNTSRIPRVGLLAFLLAGITAMVVTTSSAIADDTDLEPIKLRPTQLDRMVMDVWARPDFLQQFSESYVPHDREIEPELKSDEQKRMNKVGQLLRPDKREERLLTESREEKKLIEKGQDEAAAILKAEREEEAAAIRVKKMEQAREELEKMQSDTASPLIDFIVGNIYFQFAQNADPESDTYKENLDKAVSNFQKAVTKREGTKFRRAWLNLGLIHMRQEKYAEAIPALIRVIELGGGDRQIFGLLGYAHSSVGNDLSAESAYRMAILLDPQTKDWKMGLAVTFFRQQRYAEAAALFDRLIADEPGRADLWMYQANAYIGLNKPLKAAQNYEVVNRLGKATADSLNMLGDIYVNEEAYDLAVKSYLRAMELIPDRSGGKGADRGMRAAKVLAARGALAETKTISSQIQQLYGDSLKDEQKKELLKLQARIAVAEGSGEEEAKVLEQIVAIDPLDGEALILLGQHRATKAKAAKGEAEALVAEKKTEQAKVEREKAAKLYAQAIFNFQAAESLEKYEADAKIRHAQLLVAWGKYDEALPLLRSSQQLKPRDNVRKYLEAVQRAAKKKSN